MIPARANPFSTDRVLRERYRFSEADWDILLRRLRLCGGRGALVGSKGFGKTTLLEDLGRRLKSSDWNVALLRLSAENRSLPASADRHFFRTLDPRSALLIDGAEQLSWWRWQAVRWRSRHAGLMVITTHRPGRLPTLHRCETTPALLNDLVQALGVTLPPYEVEALHRHHGGNVREALRELYDVWAEKDMSVLSLGETLD